MQCLVRPQPSICEAHELIHQTDSLPFQFLTLFEIGGGASDRVVAQVVEFWHSLRAGQAQIHDFVSSEFLSIYSHWVSGFF